ncbi:MAG: Gfo/Idh/MocA family protein, partial [Alphaproteobacteria bacterium]
MLKIAIIGAGARGWSLARNLALHPDRATLWAVADPVAAHREAFAREHDIPPERRFETHAELLRQCRGLDGVIIACPVSAHVEPACDCLEAGVAVFLEKPMALDLGGARRIVQVAERT